VVLNDRNFRSRLYERYGAMVALGADERPGFDQFVAIGVNDRVVPLSRASSGTSFDALPAPLVA
jgi:hypothetical protein